MQIGDHRFNVQISGEGDPVIWSHGLMASIVSEDRLDLFEWDMFPNGKKLIRYDARGHGKTEPSKLKEDYHWKNLAADLIAIADGVGVQRFIAGGQSMGCATALYAGLAVPERIEKLVLVNPPTGWEKRAAQGSLYKKMAYMGGLLGGEVLAKLMRKRLDRLLPGWLIEARGKQVEGVLEGLTPLKRRTLFNLFQGAALTDLPSRKVLGTV
jgi:pimeloyl-ACP methyl ester carboxylesterase